MKKVTRIISYEPEPIIEYHLSYEEMQKVKLAVGLIMEASRYEDDRDFVLEATDLTEELVDLVFPD